MGKLTAEQQAELDKANKDAASVQKDLAREKNNKDWDAYLEDQSLANSRKYADEMYKLRNEHKSGGKRQDGTDATISDELERKIKEAISAEANTYQDARANVLSLSQICYKAAEVNGIRLKQLKGELSDALRESSFNPIYRVFGTKTPLESLWSRIKGRLLYQAINPLGDSMPVLLDKVSFKDGKVTIQDLTRSDGVKFSYTEQDEKEQNSTYKTVTKANSAFRIYVKLWLAENNYLPAPSPKEGEYVHKDSGLTLDKTEFDKLNADPKTSFRTFLKQNAPLEYAERNDEEAQAGNNLKI